MKINIPKELAGILRDTLELARAYLVGGCVRDSVLGLACKDFDIECFGVNYDQLARALRKWGRTDLVGRSFGVIKLTTGSGVEYDFAIPRRDCKTGIGHKGFEVEFDPGIEPRDAAARRDFTINSLMFDPRTDEILDFFGGRSDLQQGILRHTGEAFVEDPLRVLRGMQFAARFELTPAPETIECCRRIKAGFHELAAERIRDEWFKWATKSAKPSRGLEFLEQTEWLDHFPEIKVLRGTPQDSEWHPEGDVFTHTGHCLDALVRQPGWQQADKETRIVLSFAVLAHDFAKPQCTHEAEKRGRICIVSPGHEEAGGPLTEDFLRRINAPNVFFKRVPPLVMNHLAHLQTNSARSVRRLACRIAPATIQELCTVMTADHMGRPPLPAVVPEGVKTLLKIAQDLELQAQAPQPILHGRHLIERKMKPGPEFSHILNAAFEAQLEGAFHNLIGAQQWLNEFLKNQPGAN